MWPGRVPRSSHMDLSGIVKINGQPSGDVEYRQAYVQQEDAFFSMLTAEEVKGCGRVC